MSESISKKEFKRVKNWKERQIFGWFIGDMLKGTYTEKFWLWMKKCGLRIL